MSSIIPGYQYDIFISYRQKDNKHDGWVSEFVENLKGELESTFKEEISVYFDINPHDGLLETHDVDDSLKEKLKCLIFIPIISRTYCDPKSFAWEHEFKTFIENATNDQFGLKVKLPNGNVISRVFPVRIYDLDISDIKLCESLLGGALRGVEFIYISSGVNRPLRSKEDKPQDNSNKTIYRDQINKVANSIKEIVYCLSPDLKTQITTEEYTAIKQHDYSESLPNSATVLPKDLNHSKYIYRKLVSIKYWAIASFLIILAGGILVVKGLIRSGSHSFNRLTTYTTTPNESDFISHTVLTPLFSISPDGKAIAFSSEKGIQIRSLSNFSSKVLEGTEGAESLAFSPDGQSLVFSKNYKIYKIGLNGAGQFLVYPKRAGVGLSWGIDGNIYFSLGIGTQGIWRVSANGGEAEQITSVIDSLGENEHTWPQLLPDAKTLLFTSVGPSAGSLDSKVVIQQLHSGKRKAIINKAIFGHYLSNGQLLFADNEGTIFTVPFDMRKMEIAGEPKARLSDITTAVWGGGAYISVSETGNAVYLLRNNSPLFVVDVVDPSGKRIDNDSIPLSVLERMGHGWHGMRISPSGKLMACTGRSYGTSDIWILNLETKYAERITFDPVEDEFPVWSPNEHSIAYTSATTGRTRRLLVKNFDGDGNTHLILTWPTTTIILQSWSPDGKWLSATDINPLSGYDCYAISVDAKESISVAASQANEYWGQFSPDGKWLAYQSDESGQYEIYAVSFPNLKSKKQISSDGGEDPRWDRSGRRIFYLNNGFLISQQVEISNEFKTGKPVRMFQTDASDFDLSADGKKFYLYRKNTKRPNPPLIFINNWFEELKNKTAK